MSTPGFTAQVSLFKSATSYYAVPTSVQNISGIHPTAWMPRLPGGGGGGIGGGGLGAWGCWESWCCGCSYHIDQYGNWNCCDYRCTRCIWPY